jgi:hypothetical protein
MIWIIFSVFVLVVIGYLILATGDDVCIYDPSNPEHQKRFRGTDRYCDWDEGND